MRWLPDTSSAEASAATAPHLVAAAAQAPSAAGSAAARRRVTVSHATIHLVGLALVLGTLVALALSGRLDSGEATALLTLAGGFLGAGGATLGALSSGGGGAAP